MKHAHWKMSVPAPKKSISADEHERVVRDLASALSSLATTKQKLSVAEKTVAAQRKEILVLQRQLAAASAQDARKTSKAEEPAHKVVASPNRSVLAVAETGSEQAPLEEKLKRLQQENGTLLNCVSKQNKLIDVLKRQKILLEAATLLDISEREFAKYLELEKQ